MSEKASRDPRPSRLPWSMLVCAVALGLVLGAGGRALAHDVDPAVLADPNLGVPVLCALTAAGTVLDPSGLSREVFGGDARPTDDSVAATGHWNHVAATGEHLSGQVESLRCRRDGGGFSPPPPSAVANLADFRGTGTWDGVLVRFCVHVEDHGEPNTHDFYAIAVIAFDQDCTTTTDVLYFNGGIVTEGNVQMR